MAFETSEGRRWCSSSISSCIAALPISCGPKHQIDSDAVPCLQINVESLPDGPINPHGVGFVAKETVLRSEKEAQRMGDLNTSRVWKIKNPGSVNPLNGELRRHCPVHTMFQAS